MGKGGVVSGEDLVADGDGNDLSGGDVGLDVGADPGEGFVGITDFGDAAVREADDELDAAVREGAEDGRNGVVELDASDVDGAEERGDFFRRGEVVTEESIVDAYEGGGGCVGEGRPAEVE